MKIKCFFLQALLFSTSNVLAVEYIAVPSGVTQDQTKILGGQESKAGDWPWIAALLYRDTSDMYQAQFCGGVLIEDLWVLTAAHCVNTKTANEIDVAVGVFDLANFSGNRIGVKNIYVHPQLDMDKVQNDIALLELNQPSSGPTIPLFAGESKEGISPLLLDKMLTAIGWGMADSSSYWYYPEKLRQVNLPVVADNFCNESYSNPLIASQICAGYYDGKDVCNGDSGGPVVTQIDGTWVHVGLTSHGKSCSALNGWYGVYTRTSEFVAFIKQHVPNASFLKGPNQKAYPWLMLLLNDHK